MSFSTDAFSDATTTEQILDIAQRALRAKTVIATLPLETTELVLAMVGEPLPQEFQTEMPIAYSICRYVSEMRHPLMVDDAFTHPLLMRHSAVAKLGISAYLGVPLKETASGRYSSVLCALQIHRHRWQKSDLDVLEAAAARLCELTIELPDL